MNPSGSFAREKMLTNSFSTLPIFWEGKWVVLTDATLVTFLLEVPSNRHERGKRLGPMLRQAHDAGLQFAEAVVEQPKAKLADVAKKFVDTPAAQVILVCATGSTAPRYWGSCRHS